MEREELIGRLDMLEQVMAQLLSEVVWLRSAVNSMVVEEELGDEPNENVDGDDELSVDELRQAVEDGEITGFIGAMKGFK